MSSEFFLQLLLILFLARLFGELVARISIPPVIGELFAGVVLGPSLLNWIEPSATINILADIGIVLLLFEIGMESDITKLLKSGLSASLAAILGVVIPFILGFSISFYGFHQSLLISLFIGGALTATSIGITMRVLSDLKKQNSHETQIVLGAAIIDDILGVVLLSVLYEFTKSGEIVVWEAQKILIFILIFMLAAPLLAKLMSALIKRYNDVSEIPGLLPTMIVALLMFFAFVAHKLGAPELLGGFAAGLALSKHFILPLPPFFKTSKEFSESVFKQMEPIIHLFAPIFFVNIGLSLNLRQIDWGSPFIWMFSLILLVAAVIGKLCAGLFLFNEKSFIRWLVGIAMIPRGEVGLIFAGLGKASGILNDAVYASLIIVIALTTMIPPILMRWMYRT